MNSLSMRVLFVVMVAALPGSALNQQITDKTLYDAAWDSSYSQLVIVGAGGFIASSTNDTIWIKRGTGTSADLRSIVWTGSMFIAVGQRGTILTSPGGMDWSEQSSSTSYDLYSIYWDGSKAIAAGDNGTIITSVDGVSWSTPLNTGSGVST
jgi:hypothetical protein